MKELKECRICYSNREFFFNKLVSPCKCKGTMAYIHQYCLYKYFPDKYCTICKSYFNKKMYTIMIDILRTFFIQIFVILYCYLVYFHINILRLSIIGIILCETIIVLHRICKMIFTISNSIILLLCTFYQITKTILIIYFLLMCDDNLCVPIFTLLLYIQMNIIIETFNISNNNYL